MQLGLYRSLVLGARRGVMTSKRGNKNFYKGMHTLVSGIVNCVLSLLQGEDVNQLDYLLIKVHILYVHLCPILCACSVLLVYMSAMSS